MKTLKARRGIIVIREIPTRLTPHLAPIICAYQRLLFKKSFAAYRRLLFKKINIYTNTRLMENSTAKFS